MIPRNRLQGITMPAEAERPPSVTYNWDIENDRIQGYTDGQIAMKQTCYHILMVERYQYVVYSWNYGVELAALFGKQRNYCVPEIERRVSEALLYDDRVTTVEGFTFDLSQMEAVHTRFLVHTIHGDFDMNLEVPV